MKDVMVDIEAFGNGFKPVIVQIGAVYFDRMTGETGKEFGVNINARDAVACGGILDPDTVYWWLSQNKEAIDCVTSGLLFPLREALTGFVEFVKDADAIWSHATYDFPMLQEACRMVGVKGLKYRAARDIRTLVDLAGVNAKDKSYERAGTHHNALDDCKFQIKYCMDAFKGLRL